VDELNLNTTYQDKAQVRAPLTFETYRAAGVPACDAFNVRVQQNNNFYSVAVFVEQVDGTFLERRGLDPNGALYKLFNGINSASSGVEKKTRLGENNADLQVVINAVHPANPNRARDLFDVLDLPEVINYLAAGTIAMDWDRAVKNIYLYRDTHGTGLWQMFPWDKDLSFGKTALVNDSVTAVKDGTSGASGEPYVSHPFYGAALINCCGMNNLIDAVYAGPVTRQMYLRRLRTLMDALLQAPGTPANQLHYEARLDRLFEELKNDAALDFNRWGTTYGVPQTLAVALGALRTNYVAPRRTHLFQTHGVDNIGSYPQAVGVPHAQAGVALLQFGRSNPTPVRAGKPRNTSSCSTPTRPQSTSRAGRLRAGSISRSDPAASSRPEAGCISPQCGRLQGTHDRPARRAGAPRARQLPGPTLRAR